MKYRVWYLPRIVIVTFHSIIPVVFRNIASNVANNIAYIHTYMYTYIIYLLTQVKFGNFTADVDLPKLN
jgi:hypothetical protein